MTIRRFKNATLKNSIKMCKHLKTFFIISLASDGSSKRAKFKVSQFCITYLKQIKMIQSLIRNKKNNCLSIEAVLYILLSKHHRYTMELKTNKRFVCVCEWKQNFVVMLDVIYIIVYHFQLSVGICVKFHSDLTL